MAVIAISKQFEILKFDFSHLYYKIDYRALEKQSGKMSKA